MRLKLLPAALAPALLLGACATFDSVEAEAPAVPGAFENAGESGGAKPDPAWWTGFGDSAVDGLVAEAMDSNESLEAGVQRVEQARGALRVAGSTLLPAISGTADASTTGFDGDFSDSASIGVAASYELDLFGGNRAQRRAAESQLAAAGFSQKALALSIQSDVANAYFNLLALRERTRVAEENLAASERILELVETQYDAGAVSGFDLARQRSAVAAARARLRPLVEATRQTEHALAVLLGQAPQGFEAPSGRLEAIAPPAIDAGLPSDLLLRRPDLLAAEASLKAAEANIDAARAAFFPSIDLTAAVTRSADPLGGSPIGGFADLGATTISQVTASVLAPIFTGGRLEGNLAQAEARYLELAANYRQAVLSSLRDVEDALVSLQAAERQESDLLEAVAEAARAFEIAEVRYQAGADDLISVLDAQRNLLVAQDDLVQARQQRLTASVRLYRALGGGW